MPPSFDRRSFLRQSMKIGSTLAVGAVWANSTANAAQQTKDPASVNTNPKYPPIIDTHQHLWDLKKFRLPWLEENSVLNQSYVTKDYLESTHGLGVVKTVYMEVDVDEKQQDEEIAYVSRLCEQDDNPMAAAVISGRPANKNFKQYLEKHKNNPHLRGMRQVLHVPGTPPGFCLQKSFVAGVQALGEINWSFDLCMRPTDLADGTKLIDQAPDTRFVLDHCGNAPMLADLTAWKNDIEQLAKRKNVIGKISGAIASVPRGKWSAEVLAPVINHTLDVFGPDRVIFGGDWPVCTLSATFREWVTVLREIVSSRPAEEQKKLFHDNAMKFYRLA